MKRLAVVISGLLFALPAAAQDLGAPTSAVFVGNDDGLRERVREVLPEALFVDEPDVLVAILHRLGTRS